MAQSGTSLCLHTWAAHILRRGPQRNAEGKNERPRPGEAFCKPGGRRWLPAECTPGNTPTLSVRAQKRKKEEGFPSPLLTRDAGA